MRFGGAKRGAIDARRSGEQNCAAKSLPAGEKCVI
jgi:hypothetical protein